MSIEGTVMKAEYDLIAKQWLDMRKTLPDKDAELFDLFLDRLSDDSRILDLGCGHGTPVAKLLSEHRHRIVGVDRSEKLLEYARNDMPEHQWIHSDLESYQPEGSFDGIVIWDSMFFLPREEHLKLIEKAYRALNPQGVMIISSGGSEEDIPAFTGTMFDEEFYYDSYPIEPLLAYCESIGLNVIQSVLVNEPDGDRDKGRLGVVLKKI